MTVRHLARVFWLPLAVAVLIAPATASAAAPHIEAEYAIARIHSASLEADINPHGTHTTCAAEYVAQGKFELSAFATATPQPCSPADLGSGSSPLTATVALPNLQVDTTYHYRFLATDGGGTEEGSDHTFATFGIESFSFEAQNEAGEPETRAGGHPYQLTATIDLNKTATKRNQFSPDVVLKDLLTELPPGLVGNPTAVPPCPARDAEEERCSGDSQVGWLWVTLGSGGEEASSPLFDVVAPNGRAARLASVVNLSTDAYIDGSVRTGSDYGITTGAYNVTEPAASAPASTCGRPAGFLHDIRERACTMRRAETTCLLSRRALPHHAHRLRRAPCRHRPRRLLRRARRIRRSDP